MTTGVPRTRPYAKLDLYYVKLINFYQFKIITRRIYAFVNIIIYLFCVIHYYPIQFALNHRRIPPTMFASQSPTPLSLIDTLHVMIKRNSSRPSKNMKLKIANFILRLTHPHDVTSLRNSSNLKPTVTNTKRVNERNLKIP